MCGICGMFDMRNDHRANIGTVSGMTEKILHRGPDGVDYYVKDNIALGFSRLSIIDLESGMQPLSNEDGSIVLVCNGEIFNYLELRRELIAKGHRFKTNTDVEVIVHLYEDSGPDFIERLNGQFAFAIFDSKRNMLLCARDHVGIAPFFYTVVEGVFVFASEIKALLEYPGVSREVDLVALDQILTFPGVISPRTLFKNINSLENGNYLTVNSDGFIKIKEYWDLIYPEAGEIIESMDESDYIEKLDELIEKAVKYRLQADVPVGFYISGGLDSSIIASKIRQVSPGLKRHSFSIDFASKDISEVRFQRMMADYVESIHHEKLFHFEDISKRLRKVVYHSESALKETYNTASLSLSELVKEQGIKVVLTGEGADELFAGYVGYRFDKLRQMQPGQVAQVSALESRIREEVWGDETFFYEKDYKAYESTKLNLYSKGINDIFESVNCLNYPVIKKQRIKNRDVLHKRSYIDFKLRLPEHLLADHGDRMSFANSVEARYPFLDKDIIEFARIVPPGLKLKDFNEKYILKKLAESFVPDEIIKRPKFTFVAPGSPDLLKQNTEYIQDILSFDRIQRQGYFNADMVESLKNQYKTEGFKLNLPYDSDMLIIVMTFGIFLEEFNLPGLR
ncbi:asparagine synthase (glutamine-hydrolyzing) [Pseudobacteroides cellulosolvens]|uniref:asparagine synthase (glutamine-hydrolyzing) n=1 Tax=Pseudobacteroides cellulosolvens ATCC 35603 = DSM 2933 TaxID=398512 RepID=A0A0L6JKY9_9FIRM|nr:asparagine synthase (glutamine-hydrolyzing) [Pseudobacteroides cellulosolvens]KNY26430.1 asparagine synthase (glutamine-hydrolyzing) [Pseudobacteroides cellulosolvens ATCC 35603 = DSM 2933]